MESNVGNDLSPLARQRQRVTMLPATMISSTRSFSLFFGLALAPFAVLNAATTPSPAKPNIVILYADDMGYGQPSVYGGKLAPTPHIDALAVGGVRFSHGYATACVCSPSRVGIMSGRHPARTGHDGLTMEDPTHFLVRSESLLPESLHAAG